jgi:hypothetical protein
VLALAGATDASVGARHQALFLPCIAPCLSHLRCIIPTARSRKLHGQTRIAVSSAPEPQQGQRCQCVWTPPHRDSTLPQRVWTPPQSVWTPPHRDSTLPQSVWTPPQSVWTPPQSMWTPPQSVWTPPHRDSTLPQSVWTPPQSVWTSPQCVWTSPHRDSTLPQCVWTPPMVDQMALRCDQTRLSHLPRCQMLLRLLQDRRGWGRGRHTFLDRCSAPSDDICSTVAAVLVVGVVGA